jgi:hypothetical protein
MALAQKRGPFPTAAAGADEAVKARLAKIACGALCRGLTTPDLLAAAFAAWSNGAEVVEIAVGLARKQLAAEPGGRRPPWEPAPPPRVIERDPFTGAAMGPFVERERPAVDPLELEARRQMAVAACSQGRHCYGGPDPFTGWSRCEACGYTLVADRRTSGPIYPQPAISYG